MLAGLPFAPNELVLDVGCAVGDQARDLAALDLRVIGIDANEELLAAARARQIPNVEFRNVDLRGEVDIVPSFDGLFASFVAAYFIHLPSTLLRWTKRLRPGGHLVLIEVDRMFDHEPLAESTRERLNAYVADSLAANRYDFAMGGKLCDHVRAAGFELLEEREYRDAELAFDGAAANDVVAAWTQRFSRMLLLHQFCGSEWPAVRDDFLACLTHPNHRTSARIRRVIAQKRPFT
jgi:SAM-dependent methyltransferase